MPQGIGVFLRDPYSKLVKIDQSTWVTVVTTVS